MITAITIANKISYIIDSDQAAYALFSVNIITGNVTSAVLPADAVGFLSERIKITLAADPSIVTAGIASVLRSLVLLRQLEDAFSSSFSVVGDVYTLNLTGLNLPVNHMLLTIPFSTNSAFSADNDLTNSLLSPGGPTTAVQLNAGGGLFDGDAGLTYDKVTGTVALAGPQAAQDQATGTGAALAQADHGRLIFDATPGSQRFQLSENGGPYISVLTENLVRVVVNSNYEMLPTDHYVGSQGVDKIILPPAATVGSGKVVIIKDEIGVASGTKINVIGNGSENIDGTNVQQINTDWGCMQLCCDGTQWFIIGRGP